jgi:hypothetical protein
LQIVVNRDDWNGTGPSTGEPVGPAECPRCGTPAEMLVVEVKVVDGFYGNEAHALAAQAGAGGEA